MVYLHTTNPSIATGDGVVAAWRAGAAVGNLEFFSVPSHHALCIRTAAASRAI